MGREIAEARAFAEDLRAVYGDALASVVLYGSAARGEYVEGVSDLNLLVLLERVDAAALRQGSAAARRWVESGNPPPMLFGRDEWRQSADAFPIEFSDICDAHSVLLGDDPFADVEFDAEHLRLQCEHELKAKQVHLRERFLLGADEPESIATLLAQSVSSFLVLFRTALRLAGHPVPRAGEAVARDVGALAGTDTSAVVAALRMRREGKPASLAADHPVATGYLDAVAGVVDFVDALDVGSV